MLARGFTIAQMVELVREGGSRPRRTSAWVAGGPHGRGRVGADYGGRSAGDQPVLKPSDLFIAKVLQHDTPIVAHTSGIRRF
jgi:hypothetical protein